MTFLKEENTQKSKLATREHIWPRGDERRQKLQNSIVLAHARCNHDRGATPATDEQIEKAKIIWEKMGLPAFAPNVPGNEGYLGKALDPVRARLFTQARQRMIGLPVEEPPKVKVKKVVYGPPPPPARMEAVFPPQYRYQTANSGRDQFIADWEARHGSKPRFTDYLAAAIEAAEEKT